MLAPFRTVFGCFGLKKSGNSDNRWQSTWSGGLGIIFWALSLPLLNTVTGAESQKCSPDQCNC